MSVRGWVDGLLAGGQSKVASQTLPGDISICPQAQTMAIQVFTKGFVPYEGFVLIANQMFYKCRSHQLNRQQFEICKQTGKEENVYVQ